MTGFHARAGIVGLGSLSVTRGLGDLPPFYPFATALDAHGALACTPLEVDLLIDAAWATFAHLALRGVPVANAALAALVRVLVRAEITTEQVDARLSRR